MKQKPVRLENYMGLWKCSLIYKMPNCLKWARMSKAFGDGGGGPLSSARRGQRAVSWERIPAASGSFTQFSWSTFAPGTLLQLLAQQGADSLLEELRDQVLFLLGGALSWPTPSRGGSSGRGRRNKPLLSQGPANTWGSSHLALEDWCAVQVHRFS